VGHTKTTGFSGVSQSSCGATQLGTEAHRTPKGTMLVQANAAAHDRRITTLENLQSRREKIARISIRDRR